MYEVYATENVYINFYKLSVAYVIIDEKTINLFLFHDNCPIKCQDDWYK